MATNRGLNVAGAIGGLISAGERAAIRAVQRNLPQVVYDAQRLVNNSAILSTLFGLSGVSIRDVPTPLLGHMTLEQAEATHDRLAQVLLARKNLWYIRVSDLNPPATSPGMPGEAPLGMLDMLAVDVSYSPFTLKGDKVDIGSAVTDRLNGTEAVDLTLTVFDDEAGTIKRWFGGKCNQAANSDGTFGLPIEYCVDIEIVHAIGSPDAQIKGMPYKSFLYMRPQSMQFDLSRRDQAMQEVQLAFTEFETFQSGGFS